MESALLGVFFSLSFRVCHLTALGYGSLADSQLKGKLVDLKSFLSPPVGYCHEAN